MPNAATAAEIDSIRTEVSFSGLKSRNGGFGVRTWVFFSFTCGGERGKSNENGRKKWFSKFMRILEQQKMCMLRWEILLFYRCFVVQVRWRLYSRVSHTARGPEKAVSCQLLIWILSFFVVNSRHDISILVGFSIGINCLMKLMFIVEWHFIYLFLPM